MGYFQTLPSQVDTHIAKIQIDVLCDGEVSELTPPPDIKDAYMITPVSFMPDNRDRDAILERWKTDGTSMYQEQVGKPIFYRCAYRCL